MKAGPTSLLRSRHIADDVLLAQQCRARGKGVRHCKSGTIADFVGLLAGRTRKVASIEEINAAAANVELDRPAVEAGLSFLESGGDCADGVIAYERSWLGAETWQPARLL